MVKKVKLPAEAISFIRRQLASGDTLASYLLELPLENGTVQVYLPDAVDHSQLSLQFGGLSKFNLGEDLRMPVIAFISQFLGNVSKHVAVFEGGCYRPSEKPQQIATLNHFINYPSRHQIWTDVSGKPQSAVSIYYFLTVGNAPAHEIQELIGHARHYPSVGVLTSLPDDKTKIQVGQQVTNDYLLQLAARAEYILVGGYDDEATLIWSGSHQTMMTVISSDPLTEGKAGVN